MIRQLSHSRFIISGNTMRSGAIRDPVFGHFKNFARFGAIPPRYFSNSHVHVTSSHAEDRYSPTKKSHSFAKWIKSDEDYKKLYASSISDPDSFWESEADNISWEKKFDRVNSSDLEKGIISWFSGGKLNVTYSALDRHIEAGYGDDVIIVSETDKGTVTKYTYNDVLEQVSAICHLLRNKSVEKGDVVILYAPSTPQLAFFMLACARIGAIHSVVFGGFSSESLHQRIVDSGAKVVVTGDAGERGGKLIPLKQVVDKAVVGTKVESVLVIPFHKDSSKQSDWKWNEHDTCVSSYITDLLTDFSSISLGKRFFVPPVTMDAEDPLFLMYTSGSTGKPKGIIHSTAGYAVYAATTFKYVFSPHSLGSEEPDLHFCTADLAWITGHTYGLYGPLITGTPFIIFDGIPTYPGPDRFWDMIERFGATTLYTAPTAIRTLMRFGDEPIKQHYLESLRLLGSVGEPINTEAWKWYFEVVGKSSVDVIDTYWQTETGGCIVSGMAGGTTMKPGKATKPFMGIDAHILRSDGSHCEVGEEGLLVVKGSWPGLAKTILGDHKRYIKSYFSDFPGYYLTGDFAFKDEDGDIQIVGRADDVLNVSGHRLGSAELETAVTLSEYVTEAAVVSVPNPVKGESIYVFVVLRYGVPNMLETAKAINDTLRSAIGKIAAADYIHIVSELPKTRSGKTLRRVLKQIAAGEREVVNFGDLSTLADSSVINDIVKTEPILKPSK